MEGFGKEYYIMLRKNVNVLQFCDILVLLGLELELGSGSVDFKSLESCYLRSTEELYIL